MYETPPEFAGRFLESAINKPIQVLHIHEGRTFARVTEEQLQMYGFFEVDSTSSAEKALEKMSKKAYDIIVCDYDSSGKNSIQFLEELRKSGNKTPFILFAGKIQGEIVAKALKKLADKAEGKPAEASVEIETPRGRIIAEHTCKPLVIDRETAGVQIILRGITEQKGRERLYRAIFENAGIAMCLIEVDGTISMVNKQFEKLCGYSWQEIEDKKKWTEFVSQKQPTENNNYEETPNRYYCQFMDRRGKVSYSTANVGSFQRLPEALRLQSHLLV